jgi:hypothetical protein
MRFFHFGAAPRLRSSATAQDEKAEATRTKRDRVFEAFSEGVIVFVTDLGVGPMEINVFMKDQVLNIMRSSAKMTPGAAQPVCAAQGEEDNQAPRGRRAFKDCAQSILCVSKV